MTKALPENHQVIMPYLIVNNAAGFIDFMKEVFDGKELNRHMRNETIIMHAEVMIGGSTMMLADSTSEFTDRTAGMFIYVDDADTTYDKALAKGATSIMPPADQPYGRSCGVNDAFGNTWWITSLPGF
ncbi:MAG: VOC family protein [Chitinophagaceae bacterium]|nr:VOC family protein [Chitinophagaceae bacterium]